MFILAEMLHTPVYELREKMPISEYRGWQKYLEKRSKEAEEQQTTGGSKNLLNSEQDLLKGLVYG